MSRALCAQHRNGGLGDDDDAEQVRLDLRAEVLEARLLDGPDVAVSGIVDQHVEPAEHLDGLAHGLVRGPRVGDVEREGEHVIAPARDEVVEGGGVAGGGDQPMPRSQHCLRKGTAQAARCAGNQPHLSHESSFHLRPTPR